MPRWSRGLGRSNRRLKTMSRKNSHSRSGRSRATAEAAEDTQRPVDGALEALTKWREDLTECNLRHGGGVFDRMAEVSDGMHWPPEFVGAARAQLESASKLQLQIIDQILDVWEQQLRAAKNPTRTETEAEEGHQGKTLSADPGGEETVPERQPDAAALASMNPLQIWMDVAGLNASPDMGAMPANPMQFWMQTANMWQQSWASAFSSWAELQKGPAKKGSGDGR
jgi:hypothetical protein